MNQNMLRTWKEKHGFSEITFKFATAIDLKQNDLKPFTHTCAHYYLSHHLI